MVIKIIETEKKAVCKVVFNGFRLSVLQVKSSRDLLYNIYILKPTNLYT